MAFNRAP